LLLVQDIFSLQKAHLPSVFAMSFVVYGTGHLSPGKTRWSWFRRWLRSLPSRIANRFSKKPRQSSAEPPVSTDAAYTYTYEMAPTVTKPEELSGTAAAPVTTGKISKLRSFTARPASTRQQRRTARRQQKLEKTKRQNRTLCEVLEHLLCGRGRRTCGDVTPRTIAQLDSSERAYVAVRGETAAKRKDGLARQMSAFSAQISDVDRGLDRAQRVRNELLFGRRVFCKSDLEQLTDVEVQIHALEGQLARLRRKKDRVHYDLAQSEYLIAFAKQVELRKSLPIEFASFNDIAAALSMSASTSLDVDTASRPASESGTVWPTQYLPTQSSG